MTEQPAQEPDLPARLERERRKGFSRGISATFACLTVAGTAWAVLRSSINIPKFREVFQQIHVEMPSITLLVFKCHGVIQAILVGTAATCAILSWRRGEHRSTLIANVVGFLLSMGWIALVEIGMFLPMMSLLEGIGTRR